MHTKILLLLGEKDEYLTYKTFESEETLTNYVESLMPLIELNIQRELPLRRRLQALPVDMQGNPDYFPFAGAVMGWDVIDLDPSE